MISNDEVWLNDLVGIRYLVERYLKLEWSIFYSFGSAFIQLQARDLSKIVQAAYHLIPYFIFSPQEGESFQMLVHLSCFLSFISDESNFYQA